MELELNIKDKLNDVMRRNKRLADAEVRFYPIPLDPVASSHNHTSIAFLYNPKPGLYHWFIIFSKHD